MDAAATLTAELARLVEAAQARAAALPPGIVGGVGVRLEEEPVAGQRGFILTVIVEPFSDFAEVTQATQRWVLTSTRISAIQRDVDGESIPAADLELSVDGVSRFLKDTRDWLARAVPAAPVTGIRWFCRSCGAQWLADEFVTICPTCGGGLLERECPVCGGACGQVFRRLPLGSGDAGIAHWQGHCDGDAVAVPETIRLILAAYTRGRLSLVNCVDWVIAELQRTAAGTVELAVPEAVHAALLAELVRFATTPDTYACRSLAVTDEASHRRYQEEMRAAYAWVLPRVRSGTVRFVIEPAAGSRNS